MTEDENRQRRNIQPEDFPELNWNQDQAVDSLGLLCDYVVKDARQARQWYATKRISKRRWAQCLRGLAIVVTGMAGLVPLIGKWTECDGRPGLDPVVAGILAGVAAILVLLDKFFGFTSAWTRYMKADQQISQLLKTFYFDYEDAKLLWANPSPTPTQIQFCLSLCRSLMLEVDKIVQHETDAWVAEFQHVLKQIDAAAEKTEPAKLRQAPPGADNGGTPAE